MFNFIKVILVLVPFSLLATIPAEKTVSFQNSMIILHATKNKAPYLYRITNISNQAVGFNHPTHREMNAGWTSVIEPGQVSVILLSQPNFVLECQDDSFKIQLDCQKYIKVSSLAYTEKTANTRGDYWVVESETPSHVNSQLNQRGFVVK